jgi:hypothetical protein
MVTSWLRPLARLVTRTFVPNGRVLCAAVAAPSLRLSPLAVWVPPFVLMEYQDALPCSTRDEADAGEPARIQNSAEATVRKRSFRCGVSFIVSSVAILAFSKAARYECDRRKARRFFLRSFLTLRLSRTKSLAQPRLSSVSCPGEMRMRLNKEKTAVMLLERSLLTVFRSPVNCLANGESRVPRPQSGSKNCPSRQRSLGFSQARGKSRIIRIRLRKFGWCFRKRGCLQPRTK